MPQEKQKKYDVIVIGAGNGGLTAAAFAAKEGLKTLLVEQHNLPGGFATSFVRGRFEFEPSLHELCDVGDAESPGGSGAMFKKLGADIQWLPVPDAYRMILTDKGKELDVVLPFGQKEYIDKFEEYVPGSRAKVEEFFALCQEVVDAFAYLTKSKGVADKKYLIKNYPNFLKTAAYSLDQVQKAMNISGKVKDILNAYWCYLGIPTSRCNFTVFAAMFLKYIQKGAYIPKLRSHEISAALDKRIRDFGGEIRYNTKAEKILVKDNKITGIVTDKGETILTNHVIANINPHTVYSSMIEPKEELPLLATKTANARRVGPAGFVVYLGLNKSAEELGLNDYSYFIYRSMDTDKLYEIMSGFDGNMMQATVCLNAANPDCSPKGTSIMSFTTLFNAGSWDKVTPEEYYKLKDKLAYSIVDDFEKATGIRIKDSIEEFEVATPATFARYTGAYNGSIYGYEPDSWDSVLPRTMCLEQEILIKGLRFSGGFAFRAHGYGSSYLSGETSALLTAKDIREGK
ncbi:MAG: NAD(P)/FAD-dependent oxidoreductase [Clostridia bacterium]|nr:NAD(P)/FAD-dependent oxidoreductase [Clostridia bacterium]